MSNYQSLTTEIFELINQIRSDPKNFSSVIESTFPHYKSDHVLHRPGTIPLQTREGLSAARELYEELQELSDLQPLSYSAGLTTAANQHCIDTGPLGIVGHIGSRETSLQRRVESYGKWTGNLVEALDYGSSTAIEVVLALLVDDGLTTRPHRKALLNPSFSRIGVGAGPHSEFKTVVCVLFAVGYTENEDLNVVEASLETVPQSPSVDEWLEGAVKVTSEIREETVNGEKVRKIKNHWEMRDGSIQVIDKVEKIEPPKVEKRIEEEVEIRIDGGVEIEVREEHHHGEGHHEEHHHDAPHYEVTPHEVISQHEAPKHEGHEGEHHIEPKYEVGHEKHHEEESKIPEVHHESHVVHHELYETHEKSHAEVPADSHMDHHVTHEIHVETHEVHIEIHEKSQEAHSEKPVEHHEKPIEHHEKPVEHHETAESHHENPHPVHKKKSSGSSDSDKEHHSKPHPEHKKKSSGSSDSDKERHSKPHSGHKKKSSDSSDDSKKKKGKIEVLEV